MKKAPLSWRIKHYTDPIFLRGKVSAWIARIVPKLTKGEVVTARGELKAKYIFKDGLVVDYGTLSHRKVTNDFAGLIVDRLHTAGTDFEGAVFAYHAAGTDNTAESSGDTALGSEVLRSSGSSTEASAQVYQTVATLTFPSSNSIEEHGIFNGDTTSVRLMMDRSVFTAIAVNSSDQIEFTYQLTVESGG
jgi:hypothetical protein